MTKRPNKRLQLTGRMQGALLLRTRQAHPTWGPRKLLAYLLHRHPRYAGWPAASTVGALLKREGPVRARRRRPAPGHPGRPHTTSDAPNALWSADFKGQFRLGTGAYCYPCLAQVDQLLNDYAAGFSGPPALGPRGEVPRCTDQRGRKRITCTGRLRFSMFS
jgi:transposase InsO family protein